MKISKNVCVVDFSSKQEFLLLSDIHFDNPKCDRELLTKHLEQALKKEAPILINGDSLCMMQGKYDPRGTKKDIRPEYLKGNYIDAVIEDFVNFFTPYAHLIKVVGYGNHETNIIKRLETDPLQRAIDLLNYKMGTNIYTGGYGGWIVMQFKESKRKFTTSYKIKYFHGSGGGGPVTKNTIGHQRLDAMIDGADCIWVGHTHDAWAMQVAVERLTSRFKVEQRQVLHVQTPSYKNEYDDGSGGWHIERGAPPKPLGGYWLELDPVREWAENSDRVKIYARVYNT